MLSNFKLLLVSMLLLSFSYDLSPVKNQMEHNDSGRIETFQFSNDGTMMTGKIYLPDTYPQHKDLPAVFLIDFTEQHFKLATDEFEQVIAGVEQVKGFDALVVTLDNIPDIDAEPAAFKKHYRIYENMAAHVEGTYTNNSSRTFIGKGSEGGLVLMSLFRENLKTPVFTNFVVTDPSPKYAKAVIDLIKNGGVDSAALDKRLHFSFSTSNDRETCTQLIQTIEEAQFDWLQFKNVEYTQSNYENTYPVSYAEGLNYIFNGE